MIILVSFAAFSGAGFSSGLATLMCMAIEKALNHWDETVAYAAVFSLVGIFARVAPA